MVCVYIPSLNIAVNNFCSDGVGRTGVFIAVDRLIQYVRDHDEVDVYSVILDIRKYRQWMVKSEVSRRSIIQSHRVSLRSVKKKVFLYKNEDFIERIREK